MSKLVVLRIGEGSFDRGFAVSLQIGEENARPTTEISALLPCAPLLPQAYQLWQTQYERLDIIYRVSARRVTDASLKQDCQSAATYLCETFNQWLRSQEFRPICDTWQKAIATTDDVRLMLLTDHADVQQFPWHQWTFLSDYPKAEIGLGAIAYQPPPKRASRTTNVSILAILGNSAGIDTDSDRRFLNQLPGARVKFLVEPNSQALNDELWEQHWDILFFAGHSDSDENTGKIHINQTDSLTIAELEYAIKKAVGAGLKLAIFNSCKGLGLARDLATLHIPQTIVMREPVPDRVAQEFLKYFLTAFSQGESLYPAVRIARERLQPLEKDFLCATWLPIIYQHPAAIPPTWQELRGRTSPYTLSSLMGTLAISLVMVGAVVGIRHLGLLEIAELKAFDLMLEGRSLVQPEPPDNRIVVIEIRDKDYDAQNARHETLEDSSISNASLLRLLTVLERYHPRVIGLDLYRSSKNVPADIVQRFRQMPNLIGVCKSSNAYDLSGFPPPKGLPADRIGFSDFESDADGVLRRQLLFMTQAPGSPCPGKNIYAFSTQIALHYLEQQGIEASFTPTKDLQLRMVQFTALNANSGAYRHHLGGSQVLLNYRPVHVSSIPLTEVLEEQGGIANAIKDRIVLVGSTRQTIKDHWVAPYTEAGSPQTVPGVFMQAQMVSQILSAVLDGRSLLQPWAGWVEILWIGGWAVLGGAIAWQLRSPLYRLVGVITAATVLCVVCFGGFNRGRWIPVVPSGLAFLLASGSGVMYQIHVKEKFRRLSNKEGRS